VRERRGVRERHGVRERRGLRARERRGVRERRGAVERAAERVCVRRVSGAAHLDRPTRNWLKLNVSHFSVGTTLGPHCA